MSYKQFLNKDEFNKTSSNLKVTKVKQTEYGYIIHLFSNYITLRYKYVTVYKNGTAKIVTKVKKNYHPPYQYTVYEDENGNEITNKEFKIKQVTT